jgi:hypothetical protein
VNLLASFLAGTWILQFPMFSYSLFLSRDSIHVDQLHVKMIALCDRKSDLLRCLWQCYRTLRTAFLIDDVHESWKQWTRKLLLAAATIARSSVAGFARARIVVFAAVVVRVVVATVLVGVLSVCSREIERWVSKRNEMKDL